jgi:hypothetical protein
MSTTSGVAFLDFFLTPDHNYSSIRLEPLWKSFKATYTKSSISETFSAEITEILHWFIQSAGRF